MMKIWALTVLLCSFAGYAQVGIGTSTVDNSAVLQLNSTSKGLLVPKMTSAQRTGIASPANGLLVYDTDINQFYFYNGTAWAQAIGPAGSNGTNGTNGKTILNGTTNPSAGIGTSDDFYLSTTTSTLFGPKTATWPAGVSLIGPTGSDGVNGTNGTNGKTILNGTTNPAAGTGTTGDFYLNTSTSTLFGPKSGAGWPSGVSLIGPQGPSGLAANAPLLYSNPNGLAVAKSGVWTMVEPVTHVTIGANGALVNVTVTVKSDAVAAVAVGCNICYGASNTVGPWFPIQASGGLDDLINTTFSNSVFRTVTLTGKVAATSPGTWWIGPCFKSPADDLIIYGGMGYILILD